MAGFPRIKGENSGKKRGGEFTSRLGITQIYRKGDEVKKKSHVVECRLLEGD